MSEDAYPDITDEQWEAIKGMTKDINPPPTNKITADVVERHSHLTPRKITADEAWERTRKYINSYHNWGGPKPEAQIPARPDEDDDCVIAAFIQQTRGLEAQLAAANERIAELEAELKAEREDATYIDPSLGGD